jgi:hypothetical protein
VEPPLFPSFSLKTLEGTDAAAVLVAMGFKKEDDAVSMIETYNTATKRWTNHLLSNARTVKEGDTLLYRTCGVPDSDEMLAEVAKLTELTKDSGKRVAHFPITSPAPLASTSRKRQAEFDSEVSDSSPSNSPTPKRPRVSPPAINAVIPAPSLPKPAAIPKRVLVPTVGNRGDPSSNKGRFPLKYVADMHDRFEAIESMAGDLQSKFAAAVPETGGHFPKTGYAGAKKVWAGAAPELKTRYINAGYTDAGLWKNFLKEANSRGSVAPVNPVVTPIAPITTPPIAPVAVDLPPVLPPAPPSVPDARNAMEELLKSQPAEHQWPSTIDFAKLGGRVECYREDLEAIIDDPGTSTFWETLQKQIVTLGTERAISFIGDRAAMDAGISHCG